MKKILCVLFAMCTVFTAMAKSVKDNKVAELYDRMELKNLVDTFSVLADQKNTEAQKWLFTEDAVVDSFLGDQKVTSLVGRENIGNAFGSYLALFDIVYHINGQQTVKIEGNTAKGVAYCQVVLIGNENGKKMMTTQGVYYDDEYVKQDGKWLIKHRTSHFTWRTQQEYK